MSFVNFEVEGLAQLQQRMAIAAAQPLERLGVVRTVVSEAEGVMRASRRLVPVVTNTLRSSGTVEAPVITADEVSVGMGYGGAAKKYARKVHENPRAGKTGGFSPSGKKYYPRPGIPVPYSTVGEWKFLEKPFLERRLHILEAVTEGINRGMERL
jgi:hypothetical protein